MEGRVESGNGGKRRREEERRGGLERGIWKRKERGREEFSIIYFPYGGPITSYGGFFFIFLLRSFFIGGGGFVFICRGGGGIFLHVKSVALLPFWGPFWACPRS